MAPALPLALALLLVALSCAPSIEEGTTRPLKKEGRAGLVAVQGAEIFSKGEWRHHGEFVFYDDAGEEISRGSYQDGLEQGPWTQRYDDGCRGVGAYEDGVRQGPWQTFHRNGRLQDQGNYDHGGRTGTWVSYRDDGSKLREAEYAEGQLNGRVTYFKQDGRTMEPARSGVYADGEQIQGPR